VRAYLRILLSAKLKIPRQGNIALMSLIRNRPELNDALLPILAHLTNEELKGAPQIWREIARKLYTTRTGLTYLREKNILEPRALVSYAPQSLYIALKLNIPLPECPAHAISWIVRARDRTIIAHYAEKVMELRRYISATQDFIKKLVYESTPRTFSLICNVLGVWFFSSPYTAQYAADLGKIHILRRILADCVFPDYIIAHGLSYAKNIKTAAFLLSIRSVAPHSLVYLLKMRRTNVITYIFTKTAFTHEYYSRTMRELREMPINYAQPFLLGFLDTDKCARNAYRRAQRAVKRQRTQ
jgi:hypothetical protein